MAEDIKPLYAPQDVQEVAALVRTLEANTGKSKQGKKTFVQEGHLLCSWH
jgi:hypothetical protein